MWAGREELTKRGVLPWKREWLTLHAWVRVVEGPGLGVEGEGGPTGL